MTIEEKLFHEFKAKLSNDYFDDEINIDDKHKKIVSSANNQIKNNQKSFFLNFRNWDLQSDFSAPPQVSLTHLKVLGLKHLIKNIIKKILFFRNHQFNNAFKDDLKILELYGDEKILKKNQVHKTPGCDSFFLFGKNYSTNSRWSRYAYLSSQIVKKNLFLDGGFHLDIGSYYGGFQSFLKKEFPKGNFIMVDFPHQLMRSYIFLNQMFPNSKHLVNEEIDSEDTHNLNGCFIYIPTSKVDRINKFKIDLTTNFFSFGEMKRLDFMNYYKSEIINKSKIIYLANRFVSSPFFEKTYDTDTNVFDYLKEETHNIKYFDILPIGHFFAPKRTLFDIKRERPIGSPYFECILEKK